MTAPAAETFSQKLSRLAAEKQAAREARVSYFEAAVAAKVAELKQRDKAAGKDLRKTSRSRYQLAYDSVSLGDAEYRRLREVADAAEAAYDKALGR